MAILKCKMCGGDLDVTTDEKVVECEYCGCKQTIISPNDEKKINLSNRANRLRINCEFDKAAGIYEQIIAEFPEEAEAYWGLCLCNYGIEYVDDPITANKIPTCHRASFAKMRKDESYELALENADMAQRIVYEEQAKEIDRIMGEILAVSKDEEPYDIFICYKETDNYGSRTPDSVLAQDIYDALTKNGYRVFFSRITLEDKLGTQYEPYIFSALNSAKIMLVVGTDYEYLNAVWVKNEWSRFLKLIAKDKSKVLIPCYQNMDPYDMPDEFKDLQSQDCSKLGFMQDLLRGIDKLFGKTENQAVQQTVITNGPQVSSLLERAFIFLEDKNWESADEYAEKVLDIEPTNSQAYLVKLLFDLKLSNVDELKKLDTPLYDNDWFKKLDRYADDELKKQIKEYTAVIDERINDKNERIKQTKKAIENYKKTAWKVVKDYFSGIETKSSADVEFEINETKESITQIKQKLGSTTIEDCNSKIENINSIITSLELELSSCGALNFSRKKDLKEKINVQKIYLDNASDIIKQFQSIEMLERKLKDLQIELEKINQLEQNGNHLSLYESLYCLSTFDKVEFVSYMEDKRIKFGKYEWVLLKANSDKLLLISKNCVCKENYDETIFEYHRGNIAWPDSTIRKWLNEDFYNQFSEKEKSRILSETIATPGFRATQDKIFIPSYEEVCYGLTTKNARIATYNGKKVYWWVRNPAQASRKTQVVTTYGELYADGYVNNTPLTNGVRPAMWIKLDKIDISKFALSINEEK